MNIFLCVGGAKVTARFSPLLHPRGGAGTNVSLSTSNPGRGNKSRIKIPLWPAWLFAVQRGSLSPPLCSRTSIGPAHGRGRSGESSHWRSAEAASAGSGIHEMSSPSELSASGEKALVGQETWWHQSYLNRYGQQSGPAEGTPFVKCVQKPKATFSTSLFHQNQKDLGQERIWPF